MRKRIYMISFSNSIEELRDMEAKVDALDLPMEFWTKFQHITEFCCRCYEISEFDSLFLGEEKIVKELIKMTDELELKGIYIDVTNEVYNGKIDISKTPFAFKRGLVGFYMENNSVDNILDRIIIKGVRVLNRLDYFVLNSL